MSITPYRPQKPEAERRIELYTAYTPGKQQQLSGHRGEARALYESAVKGQASAREEMDLKKSTL